MAKTASLPNLIESIRTQDPTLADILTILTQEQNRVANLVDLAPIVQKKVSVNKKAAPNPVTNFLSTFTDTNVILTWDAPSADSLIYEIRIGSVWNTATRILTTGTLTAILDPIATGTITYLIKAINTDGVYSLTAASLDVVVSAIGSFTITPMQINNWVSLAWSEPSHTFRIDHYVITRDASVIVEQFKGQFFTIQESAAGLYTYGITAVDLFGNESPEITITLDVSGPTDYEIQDSKTSSFSGSIVNGKVQDSQLYVCVNTTKTYQAHFIDNSWASPAAQVAAGYPLYIQPLEATASYEEVFDFSTIFTNVIVNLSYLFQTITGAFSFGLSTKVSDDNITYSSPNTNPSFFVTSARYVKVKFTFTGSDDKALLAFSNFICTLAVKREIDGGNAAVFAADATGTVITFNKSFKFVESITITPLDTAIRTWVYDFAGGVNPTSFKVKLWNAAGTRVDGTVSWKARGVL